MQADQSSDWRVTSVPSVILTSGVGWGCWFSDAEPSTVAKQNYSHTGATAQHITTHHSAAQHMTQQQSKLSTAASGCAMLNQHTARVQLVDSTPHRAPPVWLGCTLQSASRPADILVFR